MSINVCRECDEHVFKVCGELECLCVGILDGECYFCHKKIGVKHEPGWAVYRESDLFSDWNKTYDLMAIFIPKIWEVKVDFSLKNGGVMQSGIGVSGSMSFGCAVEKLKLVKKVARKGWNGKGMFLFQVSGDRFESGKAHGVYDYPHAPFIAMKTADDKVIPWLASQADVLAEDWEVIE
jgi:hypothetical protein